jgi:hypothetical protein
LDIVYPRPRFAFSPWQDLDPRRLELEQRLPPDHLAPRLDIAVDRLDLSALSCWYAFRDRIAPYLVDWNRQVLAQAVAQGRTPAERGALDGTTIAADASRRRLLDESTLQRRDEELRQAKAAAPEAAPRPAWMAPTAEGRRRQEERLRRTRERLDELQRRNAGKRSSKRKKRERIVVSPSDPEAALGRDKEGVFRPLYNVQAADDLDSPLILAYEVFAQPNDAGLLRPMLARLREALGRPLRTLLADSAYAGGGNGVRTVAARDRRRPPADS